jgi:hypothetical protein
MTAQPDDANPSVPQDASAAVATSSPSQLNTRSASNETAGAAWIWLSMILLVAVLARAYAFPDRYYFNDMDEPVYLQGGPQVLEGLPPVYHYAFAGPITWVSWVYTGGLSAIYVAKPTAEELQVPFAVRPFVAINHAIFDVYHDFTPLRMTYIVLSMGVSLAGVIAGFNFGRRRGGIAGAVLLGGTMAVLPVIVSLSAMAKPYTVAWSCVVIAAALVASAEDRPRRMIASAIVFGVGASSRVEMLGVLPVLILVELWMHRKSLAGFVVSTIKYLFTVVLTIMVVAPWSWTNLMGNLRAIATIRLGPPAGAVPGTGQTLLDVVWTNALGLPILMLLAAWMIAIIHFRHLPRKYWPWLGALLGTLLLCSVLKPTGYGMRHQGPAFMSLLLLLPYVGGVISLVLGRKRAMWIAFAALVLAGIQTARACHEYHSSVVRDSATDWVNAHVPPGSIVYFSPTFRDPLPTPQSADAIWDEVSGREASSKKFEQGLARLNLGNASAPRAMSEQIMVTERGLARRFYILGSRADFTGPRFDLRRYDHSVVFGLKDPVPAFLKTGGVLIYRGDGPPPGLDAAPAVKWTNASGHGTYVFVSPDLVSRLLPTTQAPP